MFPDVFKSRTDKNEVVFPENLHRVADDATGAFAVFDEVELELVVAVERIIEFVFVAVDQIEAIFFRERRYFCDCG